MKRHTHNMKMVLLLLLLTFVSGRPQDSFVFPGQETVQRQGAQLRNQCVTLKECPALLVMLKNNPNGIREFDSCGFNADDEEMFTCPDLDKDECNCTPLNECQELQALIEERGIRELYEKDICGFDKQTPKYCCPFEAPKKRVSAPPRVAHKLPNLDTRTGIGGSNDDQEEEENFENDDAVEEEEEFEEEFEEEVRDPLDENSCGFVTNTKIFGGQNADHHEFPWAAALAYINPVKDSRMYLCGGTLVAPNFVLTAAHCINSRQGHEIAKVRLGHSNLASPEAIDVDIESIFIHPDYEEDPLLFNDLALLKLSEWVTVTSDVMPICLPIEDEEIVEPVVVGWGLVNHENATEHLQKLKLNMTTLDDCENTYRKKIRGFSLDNSQLCAVGEPGTDSCKGDSGGPLMFLDERSQFRIVGITSFGTIRCDSSVPGVYTNVAFFKDWIETTIRDKS